MCAPVTVDLKILVKTRTLEKVQIYGLELLRNRQRKGTSAKTWRHTRFKNLTNNLRINFARYD